MYLGSQKKKVLCALCCLFLTEFHGGFAKKGSLNLPWKQLDMLRGGKLPTESIKGRKVDKDPPRGISLYEQGL